MIYCWVKHISVFYCFQLYQVKESHISGVGEIRGQDLGQLRGGDSLVAAENQENKKCK